MNKSETIVFHRSCNSISSIICVCCLILFKSVVSQNSPVGKLLVNSYRIQRPTEFLRLRQERLARTLSLFYVQPMLWTYPKYHYTLEIGVLSMVWIHKQSRMVVASTYEFILVFRVLRFALLALPQFVKTGTRSKKTHARAYKLVWGFARKLSPCTPNFTYEYVCISREGSRHESSRRISNPYIQSLTSGRVSEPLGN